LKETASLLKAQIRTHVDTCYRYGGDEFVIIMPETRIAMAKLACERIRRHLREHFVDGPTASIGVAEWVSSMKARNLVEAADRAMYSGKTCGGNSIILAPNINVDLLT
jgi:diguanylate cyclase (GGDEF)-like protein